MDDVQAIMERLLERVATLEASVAALQEENRGLREENRRLSEENRKLLEENRKLSEENRQLRDQIDQLRRTNARQAGPFRRRESKKVPDGEKKRPGRKPGHPGSHRAVPEQIDDEIEKPLDGCPKCGGPLGECQPVEQIIEELLPVQPRIVRLVTWEGHCPKCGEVRSTHPLQTSRGRGAAKVQLGPRALAVATALNKHFGLSMRRTCQVLDKLFGLRFSPGGLSQAADRVADRLAGDYATLQKDIRGAPATFADETSWWVGGPGWWLWTFTTPSETFYHVDRSRGSGVVKEILGEEYSGILVSDCLATYDPLGYRKHKCIAHHLQAISEARESPGEENSAYLNQWKLLFQTVITWHRLAVAGTMDAAALSEARARAEAWIDRLLEEPVKGVGEIRIRNRLAKQRPHLLGCLYDLSAEPTNNRAERSLRPAVIARKISCGNKTERGRQSWQILASLAATCSQRGHDLIDYLATRLPLPAISIDTG